MSSAALTHVVATPQPRNQSGRWWLALTAGLVAAAAFPSLRLELGGFLVPLHVIPLILAARLALPRIRRIPARIRTALGVFMTLFALCVLQYGTQFGDLVKMATSVVTIVTMASLVRNKDDFLLGLGALAVAGLVINARGLMSGVVDNLGYQPLKGIGNKNAYSLYALPYVLLSGFALLHFRQSKLWTIVLTACILSTAFLVFAGANRSGWGGLVLIALLLAAQARRWRALFLVGMLGLASYGALALLGDTQIFAFRVEQTTSGTYESDETRQSLFRAAVEIGLENPILGVSVQHLPYELAKRISFQGDMVDPHNLVGYILGGGGLFTFFALLALGFQLWRRPNPTMNRNEKLAHDLIRIIILVFIVRGFFSREIFFVAPFPIALGLALGLLLIEDTENWNLKTDPR
jgi:O-antigen ligase